MPAYKDKNCPIEERIEDLLSQMTLAEKVGQTVQVFMGNYVREVDLCAAIRQSKIGSYILSSNACAGNVETDDMDADILNRYQKIAIEESRLGIPLLFGRDIIHGFRTVAPIPLAQAASWDRQAVKKNAGIAALEATSAGVHWTFSPMVDICRDPRWGRIIESFGEDPCLVEELGIAMTTGYQGDDLADPSSILACAKHFVAYGFAEGGRDYDASEITQTTLHNVVLRPFKALVERANIATFMSSFQTNGSHPVTGSELLLQNILRKQWQFDGMLVSDWGGVEQLYEHGSVQDQYAAAIRAITAGVDMEMVSTNYNDYLIDAVEKNKIDLKLIDRAVRNILRAKFRAGIFEHPYTDLELQKTNIFTPQHRAEAYKFAANCTVLAKNKNNILPLNNIGDKKIAVLGPMLHEQRALLGSWVLDGKKEDTSSLATAFRAAFDEKNIVMTDSQLTDYQLQLAAEADYIICCLGESNYNTGENHAISRYQLPVGQEQFIEALARFNKPLIVICASGRPLPIKMAELYADALLYIWHGVTEAARATVDVIKGILEPGGRFPMTVPKHGGHIPIYYNRKRVGKLYDDQSYRYYDDDIFAPLYHFGYGLGYSSFVLNDIKIAKDRLMIGVDNYVTARLTNTGNRASTTVVQCYINDPQAAISRPMKELVDFLKISLAAGASKELKLKISAERLGFYLDNGDFIIEAGEIEYALAFSAEFQFELSFEIIAKD